MRDYFLLMHDDATDAATDGWERYIRALREAGVFEGGSAIGGGMVARKSGTPAPLAAYIAGFIRVTARDIEHARSFLDGIRSMRPAARWRSGNCRRRGDCFQGLGMAATH
jgi:hypothetical protein